MINAEDAKTEEVEKLDRMEEGWWYSQVFGTFAIVIYFCEISMFMLKTLKSVPMDVMELLELITNLIKILKWLTIKFGYMMLVVFKAVH